jgi:hypothetical protein
LLQVYAEYVSVERLQHHELGGLHAGQVLDYQQQVSVRREQLVDFPADSDVLADHVL